VTIPLSVEDSMYPDPKRVRDNRITLRLDDYEFALVTALANYVGEQPATLVRETLLNQARLLLPVEANVEPRRA
jgi:hypothetical protein